VEVLILSGLDVFCLQHISMHGFGKVQLTGKELVLIT
jgi:hypothetical protein